jgi:16S rRNA processing protein RimM
VESLCHIGKLVATFGLKGQLVLKHDLGKKTSFPGVDAFFLESKGGEMLPYFLQSTLPKNHTETYVKLEGTDSKEQAQMLSGRSVWLPEAQFRKLAAKDSSIALLGYQLYDMDILLGEILEVIEQPHQVLCRIDWKGKEALIPLHEHFLRDIDRKKKTVVVQLPDGLLDIYAG